MGLECLSGHEPEYLCPSQPPCRRLRKEMHRVEKEAGIWHVMETGGQAPRRRGPGIPKRSEPRHVSN